MKKIGTILMLLFCVSLTSLYGQNIQIRGIVTDASDNSPLPGCFVVVKGTNTTTSTFNDGTYMILAPAGAVLVFSFIGMNTQEVPIEGRQVINVALNSSNILSEVVVTALGITREKKALGYATQDVKADKLSMTGNTDIARSLQGKIVGVELKTSSGMPGASSQMVIRGARSFTGDNTPLYIIDGMPVASTPAFGTGNSVTGSDYSNRAIDIDPNDIESLNVLRGQAAAALYGLRAANGAIVITTKSGKGKTIGKTNVSITQTTSFDVVSRHPEYQMIWAQGINGGYVSNQSNSWGCLISELPNDPVYGGNKVKEGLPGTYLVPQLETAGYGEKAWVKPQAYDNWGDYFKTGVSSTTSILVTRAENTGNFAVGISYTDQTGIALNTGLQKWNAKASGDKKLNDSFTMGFSANFMRNNIDKLSGANDGSLTGVISAPTSYDLKGIPYHVPGNPYTHIYYRGGSFDNPYWVPHNNVFNEGTNRFFGNMYVQFATQLAANQRLSVRYQLGADSYVQNLTEIMGFGRVSGNCYIDNTAYTYFTYNSLATATYDWKINSDLDFNIVVGNELNHDYRKNVWGYGADFNFGGWNHIENTKNVQSGESQSQARTVGFFGSLSLSYLNMLFFNATARQDIASTMPPNNRNFFYPSVSLGFIFTELAPFKPLTWFNFGKLRGSYAEVGAASTRYLEPYYVTPGYGGGFWGTAPILYPLNGVSAFRQTAGLYDPNMRPQNTKSWEIGVQLNFIKNRIGIDYTYANQNTVDQIFSVPMAGSTGVASLIMNSGQMKTITHELVLNFTPVEMRNFRWDLNMNLSITDNTCVELADGVESIMLGGFVTPQVRAQADTPYPIIYGNQFKKDSQGRVLVDEDPNSDYYGMPMAGEPGEIGVVPPKYILGGGTTLTYKSISLGAVVEWRQGGHMYSGMNGLNDSYGVSKRTEDRTSTFVYKGWKEDGTPNDIVRGGPADPRAYQWLYSDILGGIDEAFIYPNSFVKLRELSLRYALPRTFLPKLEVSISAFARNILLWTELPNADPEATQGNNNMMGGFERFSLPQTTSYGFGININF